MTQPGGNAGAGNVRPVGQRFQRRRRDPFGDQRTRAKPGRVGTQRAQVAQPGEAVREHAQHRRSRQRGEIPRLQRDRCPGQLQFALQQVSPAGGVAGPRIAQTGCAGASGMRVMRKLGKPRHVPALVAQPGGGGRADHAAPRNAAMAAP